MWSVKTVRIAKVATQTDSINNALRLLCGARRALMAMQQSSQSPLRASLFMLQETFHVNRPEMVVHCELKKIRF